MYNSIKMMLCMSIVMASMLTFEANCETFRFTEYDFEVMKNGDYFKKNA